MQQMLDSMEISITALPSIGHRGLGRFIFDHIILIMKLGQHVQHHMAGSNGCITKIQASPFSNSLCKERLTEHTSGSIEQDWTLTRHLVIHYAMLSARIVSYHPSRHAMHALIVSAATMHASTQPAH